ncbi:MAG: isoleucine--tRNA ligase, partial [Acidobacteriota bacterium]
MAQIASYVPVGFGEALGPATDATYLYFLDSTLIRVWCFDDTLYDKTCQYLDSLDAGRFVGLEARHPFIDRSSRVILSEHVTLDAGTGCVHTAPGHGHEDSIAGVDNGLPIYTPVDDAGRFTAEVEGFAGRNVFDANEDIITLIGSRGMLLAREAIVHQYPHCWRSKDPVIFRATEQWFIALEKADLRSRSLEAIRSVRWVPAWGMERMRNMLKTRPDWCISRQRSWGVPIPAFACTGCGRSLMDAVILDKVADIFRREGSDVWWKRSAREFLEPDTTCSGCGGREFRQEKDIIDVWFESGVSHAAVLGRTDDMPWPAQLYVEGHDQYRGWFNSSLLVAVANRGRPPYDEVITHGFTLDGQGQKMSKSLGNVISPQEVIRAKGAEILRLWVSMVNYIDDMRLSEEILDRNVEAYRKVRNTFRYILGNIHDFDPERDIIEEGELLDLDRWALSRLSDLTRRVRAAFERYEFHTVHHALHNFCAVTMSSLYFDILKDRLYTSVTWSHERRSAQSVLYRIGHSVCRMIAPILPFTAEEVWSHLPRSAGDPESVHLTLLPEAGPAPAPGFLSDWEQLLKARETVTHALEADRRAEKIGSSLEAAVRLKGPAATMRLLERFRDQLPALFIVSKVELEEPGDRQDPTGLEVGVFPAAGSKCERCWNIRESVGSDAEFPNLCSRCVSAIRQLHQNAGS